MSSGYFSSQAPSSRQSGMLMCDVGSRVPGDASSKQPQNWTQSIPAFTNPSCWDSVAPQDETSHSKSLAHTGTLRAWSRRPCRRAAWPAGRRSAAASSPPPRQRRHGTAPSPRSGSSRTSSPHRRPTAAQAPELQSIRVGTFCCFLRVLVDALDAHVSHSAPLAEQDRQRDVEVDAHLPRLQSRAS